jgi:superfamily II DNA or RNA helicase
MEKGYTKRPLWVVPNPSIAKQWIDTAKDIVPNVKINNLGNLGADFKVGLEGFGVKDGEITIITKEGLQRLEFSDQTYATFTEKFKYISDDLNAHKSKRKEQQDIAGNETLAGKLVKGTRSDLSFEKLGFDYLVYDEVHQANHIVSKVKMDKGKATDFRAGQPSSNIGIKTWLASQYIQSQNDGKNIVALSATPFTNNPLEYYSIISLMGNKYLEKIGATNVNDFFIKFMEASSEYEVKASGKVEKKNDIRGFKNNRQWRNLLNQFAVFANSPKDIIVPDKINKAYYIPQNAMQMDFNNQAQALFNDKVAGALLAVGEMKKIAFSPFISRYYDGVLTKANYKMFVDGSPKIKATMELIKQNKKDKPEAGQIIYTSDTGKDTSPIMMEYLIKEVGFKPEEVGIINGDTPQAKRMKIQEDYNAGKMKVVIGSDAIQVGMELQINSTDLYIIGMPWNFTSLRQITGRIHRQNNKWKNVRINIMMSENSSDVFQMQKIQNKQDRYEASIQEDAQEVDLGDINSEEMKTDLITDPVKKADFIIQQKLDLLNNKKETAKAEQAFALRKFEKLRQAQAKVDSTIQSINYEKEQNKKRIEAGREVDMYWTENYTKKLAEYQQDLQDTRNEFEAKGIDITRLDEINKRTDEEIKELDKEIIEVNEGT